MSITSDDSCDDYSSSTSFSSDDTEVELINNMKKVTIIQKPTMQNQQPQLQNQDKPSSSRESPKPDVVKSEKKTIVKIECSKCHKPYSKNYINRHLKICK
jgi:ribosomal protein L44E